MTDTIKTALATAIRHIEHMANWITARGINHGYSFEALGEDLPNLKKWVAASGDAIEKRADWTLPARVSQASQRLAQALKPVFITTSQIGNPEPTKREYYLNMKFRSRDQLHERYDALALLCEAFSVTTPTASPADDIAEEGRSIITRHTQIATALLESKNLPPPCTIDLKPALDWYLKATGDFGDDYLNSGGWDDLHNIVGNIGTALGVAEDGDVIPPAIPMLSVCQWRERDQLGRYVTGCGKVWISEDGDSPESHSNRFCFHCGGRIDDITTEAEHELIEAATYPKDEDDAPVPAESLAERACRQIRDLCAETLAKLDQVKP